MKKKVKTLRAEQLQAVNYAMAHPISVIAGCPNFGKTEVSIEVITRYLRQNPKHRVLVFAHSTNVLRQNYYTRLAEERRSFTFSTNLSDSAQVHICLPHNEREITEHYDFIIVDEAHQNYLAKRIQRILAAVEPTKQMLLTGTPSTFIKTGGYNIFFWPLNEMSKECMADLGLELVASDYEIELEDYNQDLDINVDYDFTEAATNSTLEKVVLKLIKRVKTGLTATEFNNPNLWTKLKSWLVFKNIGRTMIVCRSIIQAEQVYRILIKNKVSVTISASDVTDKNGEIKADKTSSNIAEFKEGKYDVLVVVDRATLGYSDDGLFNIIDMSGTLNPNLIYQMFARVVRGTPDMKKLYMKVCPKRLVMMDLTHIYVCAALMLTERRFLEVYNGKNLNGMQIPMPVSPDNGPDGFFTGEDPNAEERPYRFPQFPGFAADVIDVFKNILHNIDNDASVYKLTTIGEVKYQLGLTETKPEVTFDDIIASAAGERMIS